MSDTATSNFPQQVEAARFGSAVSESLLQSMQANINLLLKSAPGLGSFEGSLLDEATFNDQKGGGTNWALMDGRDVSASAYAVLTGNTSLPDWRGRYVRMKDNAAGVDPAGDLATGSTYDDALQNHNHGITFYQFGGGPVNFRILYGFGGASAGTNDACGGVQQSGSGSPIIARANASETRVKTGVGNWFIRIN